MTKFKLGAGLFIIFMVASTMVFSQTAQSTTKQSTDTKQTSVTVNKTTSSTDAHANCQHHMGEQSQKGECKFIDDNKDGKCDKCGNTSEECKSKCKTAEKSGCEHKKAQGCSKSCSKTCNHKQGSN